MDVLDCQLVCELPLFRAALNGDVNLFQRFVLRGVEFVSMFFSYGHAYRNSKLSA